MADEALRYAISNERRRSWLEENAAAFSAQAASRWSGWTGRRRALELVCEGALLSPFTGVVDGHALMLALLQGEAEDRGAVVALHAPLTGGGAGAGGPEAQIGGEAPLRLSCRGIVNAAGLGACEQAWKKDPLSG